MHNATPILIIGLMLLAGCAGTAEQEDESGCPADETIILNEDTGNYECVNGVEWEQILRDLDEERY